MEHPKVSIQLEDEAGGVEQFELQYLGDTKNYWKYGLLPAQEGMLILRTLYVHKSDTGG